MLYEFNNPIIPGYNPDPSICRVGDDFYLVNSTFEFFPGVPVYHSKNLVNWELINHCLSTKEQLFLEGCRNSGGIYAPTLRYHDGVFFMITTNVTHRGNFVVHTRDIRGEFSIPAWIDQGGIDPSLFWDDDDSCYYCSTGNIDGVRGIVAFEINPFTGEILSDKHLISTGCGGQCAEGPHIYKKEGYYYLLLAEGGTEYGHRVTIQRSRNVFGPYEECPHNPILTHKEYKYCEIQATGHGDLVEDGNGNWWMVCLGIRNYSRALLHNLGRETFLCPVIWENGWPIVGNNGTIEPVMKAPLPQKSEPVNHSVTIDFSNKSLGKHLFYTRNPEMKHYKHNPDEKSLTLIGTKVTINEPGTSPTIMSIRQPAFVTTFTAVLEAAKTTAKRAGIAAYYNNDYHYDIYLCSESDQTYIGFYKHIHDMGVELLRVPLKTKGNVILKIETDREKYSFSYKEDTDSDFTFVGSGSNAGLSTEGTMTMTFTGTLFSIFAEEGTAVFKDKIELNV
jgi:xylan 1,4-beta-xylosidase